MMRVKVSGDQAAVSLRVFTAKADVTKCSSNRRVQPIIMETSSLVLCVSILFAKSCICLRLLFLINLLFCVQLPR